ncbi:hypothetical protein BGW36DRAFT_361588 [Talaromyces proteolyticus]|uniref:Uncharacterized protein n=1 Tax=Talaromyces proteolyticus TaxID=1131652 RepID=A0AAD4KKF1_9EURO|nr:uncharacterized protein BGW36DRAFT_361588 [Talaromyces proteolyticus]KAH8693747.1 hypothetical protein BGW36DRAFT_361588 [Talaromyces proteolyticus]
MIDYNEHEDYINNRLLRPGENGPTPNESWRGIIESKQVILTGNPYEDRLNLALYEESLPISTSSASTLSTSYAHSNFSTDNYGPSSSLGSVSEQYSAQKGQEHIDYLTIGLDELELTIVLFVKENASSLINKSRFIKLYHTGIFQRELLNCIRSFSVKEITADSGEYRYYNNFEHDLLATIRVHKAKRDTEVIESYIKVNETELALIKKISSVKQIEALGWQVGEGFF